MFNKLENFIKERMRPSLYRAPNGKRLVVMEAEDYEALSGVEADALPAFRLAVETEPLGSVGELISHQAPVGGRADGQNASSYNPGVDALDNASNTERNEKDGTIASRLGGLQLEEEIKVEDLPL